LHSKCSQHIHTHPSRRAGVTSSCTPPVTPGQTHLWESNVPHHSETLSDCFSSWHRLRLSFRLLPVDAPACIGLGRGHLGKEPQRRRAEARLCREFMLWNVQKALIATPVSFFRNNPMQGRNFISPKSRALPPSYPSSLPRTEDRALPERGSASFPWCLPLEEKNRSPSRAPLRSTGLGTLAQVWTSASGEVTPALGDWANTASTDRNSLQTTQRQTDVQMYLVAGSG